MTRRAVLLLLTALLVLASVAVAPAAQAVPRVGDLIEVRLRDLRPTQPEIGYDQIHYKLGRYASTSDTDRGKPNQRFDDWCETNSQGETATSGPASTLRDPSSFTCTIPVGAETPASVAETKTVVIGPGGALYLTDGHHTMTSFLETADGGPDMRIRVRVQDDLHTLAPDAFWTQMVAQNRARLRTADGRTLRPEDLPRGLGLARLGDDPYRGLVYFTRDIGYTPPADAAEFLEFFWADWLRTRIPAWNRDDPAAYLATVERASRLMSATPGDTQIAPGRTADSLGRLPQWNGGKKATGGAFGDLSAPITAAKPGKIAFAIVSRAKVLPDPPCTRTVTGTVTGPVTASGARVVELCGTTVTGPTSVVRTTERRTLTGYACTPNDLRGPVVDVGNRG